jgi:regulator of nucleoside diphosphate kinase
MPRRPVVNMADFANLSLLQVRPALKRKLDEALVVPSEEVPPDVVTMQSRVLLADAVSGERRLVRVVYPGEADPSAGLVSVLDPLGADLLAASVGDVIQGNRIEEIVFQPENSMRANLVVRGEPR